MGSNQKKIDYKIKTKIFALLVTNRSMNAIKSKCTAPIRKYDISKKQKNLLLDLQNAIIIWFMGDACSPDFIAEIRRGIIYIYTYDVNLH